MAYEKYVTDAIVLGSRPRGEADRVLALYTRAFGLAYAQAKGIRVERSRLRYALPNLARSTVSLVRGKSGWRIVGAVPEHGITGVSPTSRSAMARIAHLMQRLVVGEERNDPLFDVVISAYQELAMRDHTDTDVSAIETLCVARVLYILGYLAPETSDMPLFDAETYEAKMRAHAGAQRERLIRMINTAIAETHL